MIPLRDARIAMEYLTGTPVTKIAEIEGMSHQRVYQLLQRTARHMGCGTIEVAKADVPTFALRLRNFVIFDSHIEPDTPRAFFHELLHELRTHRFG